METDEMIGHADRVSARDARRAFAAGRTVLVDERGEQPQITVWTSSVKWDRTRCTWSDLARWVRDWRDRYPNQRYYVMTGR